MPTLRHIAAAAALWAASGAAAAAPGDHIRAGEVEIVPEIAVGTEYRTNVYRDEAVTVPSANLRIAPGASAAANTEDTDFRFGFGWQLRKFFFLGDDSLGAGIPTADRIRGLDRFNDFQLSAGLNLTKRSPVGLILEDTMNNRNWTNDADFANVPFTTQFRNQLDGKLRINPGPALEFTPGGRWSYDNYQRPGDAGDRSLNQRNVYGPTLDAKWGFLPRTALVVNTSWLFYRWATNEFNSAGAFGNTVSIPDSQAIKALAGIDGRFTEKLALQGFIGYGTGIYAEDSLSVPENLDGAGADATGLDGLLAKVNVRYNVTGSAAGDGDTSPVTAQGSRVTVGYQRDFRDSFFTNYVALDQIYAQWDGRVGDFAPLLRYQLRFEDYEGDVQRQDIVNRLTVDAGYYFDEWIRVNAGMWWQQRASSSANVEYDDFNIFAAATFIY